MKRVALFIALWIAMHSSGPAQNSMKGIVVDGDTQNLISGVSVLIKDKDIGTVTNNLGVFTINNIPNGEYILIIRLKGYQTLKLPINLKNNNINLDTLHLFKEFTENQDLSVIVISDDELNDDTSTADNIVGLLQASKDIYLRTAAFEFGNSFFRVKGLDSENGTVLINGIQMNKPFDGRPQWSHWGGLNDATRNQEFSNGLTPSYFTFGGLLGTTHINVRASEQRSGTKISYASTNRSYTHRAMITHTSGLLKNEWAYTIAMSRREGKEGYNNGTFYKASSFLASVERKLNEYHSFNFTAIYTPNRRGKSSANTQEVYNLKGIRYNSYWGYQGSKKRNSRYKELIEPLFILSHYWKVNSRTDINTNIAYQLGHLANSRIDFGGTTINSSTGFPEGGGLNPDPTYYQKLPSYALKTADPAVAYGLQQQFLKDGQLNWDAMYQANYENRIVNNSNAMYIQYEDRVEDRTFTGNVIVNSQIKEHIQFTGALHYKSLISENFASVVDLLGEAGYLDIDNFADDLTKHPEQLQNNVLDPNRIVSVGDRFKYNYLINSKLINAFSQAQFTYNKMDFYIGINYATSSYQREGLYQNGGFINSSLGKGSILNFSGLSSKLGLVYKITGRHLISFNSALLTNAPTIRNTFANSRENHATVPNISKEKTIAFDLNYTFRSPIVQAKLTGYFINSKDANEIAFFYADGIEGDEQAFIQQILQGVDKRYLGIELGVEAQITPTIKLKGAAAFGQHTYNNNPNLYIASEDFIDSLSDNEFLRDFGLRDEGQAYLKNYRLSNGPQQAYSVGFEYRDPENWWFGATSNLMSHAYIAINPLQRSANFYTDFDGLPYNDYDPNIAKKLLRQEKIPSYTYVNMVGGKSWRIDNSYISLFASLSNVFNARYKTGGFEQGRNANYRQLLEEKSLETQVFGPKYWYGRGTSYFLNINYRF